MKKTLFKILLSILTISAVVCIITLIIGAENILASNIMGTTIILFGFSILGLFCNIAYDKFKMLSQIGIIVCLISCIYCLLNEWNVIPYFDIDVDLSLVIISIAFAHTCLLLGMESSDVKVKYIKLATVLISLINYMFMLIEIFVSLHLNYRVYIILFMLSILGTIAIPVIDKIKKM